MAIKLGHEGKRAWSSTTLYFDSCSRRDTRRLNRWSWWWCGLSCFLKTSTAPIVLVDFRACLLSAARTILTLNLLCDDTMDISRCLAHLYLFTIWPICVLTQMVVLIYYRLSMLFPCATNTKKNITMEPAKEQARRLIAWCPAPASLLSLLFRSFWESVCLVASWRAKVQWLVTGEEYNLATDGVIEYLQVWSDEQRSGRRGGHAGWTRVVATTW